MNTNYLITVINGMASLEVTERNAQKWNGSEHRFECVVSASRSVGAVRKALDASQKGMPLEVSRATAKLLNRVVKGY